MAALAFRNIDVSPAAPVDQRPYEGLVTAIERGYLADWRRIAQQCRSAPWGRIARWVLAYAEYGDASAVAGLLGEVVHTARQEQVATDRDTVARRVREAIALSGLTARDFAAECGTSAPRLSTYANGRVDPGAALLIRIERTAQHLAAADSDAP